MNFTAEIVFHSRLSSNIFTPQIFLKIPTNMFLACPIFPEVCLLWVFLSSYLFSLNVGWSFDIHSYFRRKDKVDQRGQLMHVSWRASVGPLLGEGQLQAPFKSRRGVQWPGRALGCMRGKRQDSRPGDTHKPAEIKSFLQWWRIFVDTAYRKAYIALPTLLFVGGAHADLKLDSAPLRSLHPLEESSQDRVFTFFRAQFPVLCQRVIVINAALEFPEFGSGAPSCQ